VRAGCRLPSDRWRAASDHATIARFRARHQKALGGLFSQVLRLLAAEGMVALGTLSLDGTKLAGNAAQKANKTLPPSGWRWERHGGSGIKVRVLVLRVLPGRAGGVAGPPEGRWRRARG
jgi:hypothetical protein